MLSITIAFAYGESQVMVRLKLICGNSKFIVCQVRPIVTLMEIESEKNLQLLITVKSSSRLIGFFKKPLTPSLLNKFFN